MKNVIEDVFKTMAGEDNTNDTSKCAICSDKIKHGCLSHYSRFHRRTLGKCWWFRRKLGFNGRSFYSVLGMPSYCSLCDNFEFGTIEHFHKKHSFLIKFFESNINIPESTLT